MNNSCFMERFSKIGLGFLFLLISFAFAVSGVTVLPIFGFIVAVPLLGVSVYFFRAHLNRECQIEETGN
jgi:hypothetical protein